MLGGGAVCQRFRLVFCVLREGRMTAIVWPIFRVLWQSSVYLGAGELCNIP
jgi:hypothetical protein